MRFDIAVAAILVAEGLSSSVDAAAQGTPHASDLREIARLRKEAIEAISNRNPNGRREYRMFQRTPQQQQQQQQQLRKGGSSREGRNLFEDKIRQFSEDRRLQQFPGTATTITNQQLENKATAGDGPIIDSDFPDLGILPLTLGAANPQRKTEDALNTNVIALSAEVFCDGFERIDTFSGAATPSCETCQVTYVDVNDPESAYNVEIDCPNISQEYVDGFLDGISNFEYFCSDDACQDTCNVDKENFLVDMKDCSFSFEDFLGDMLAKPLASTGKLFCKQMKSIDRNGESATPSCETCQVTYVDDNDPESAYNLEIDCPNIPQEYVDDDLLSTISAFETFCSYDTCQETCNVDKENFLVDMKDCSYSNFEDFMAKPIASTGERFCKQMKSIDTNGDLATPSCETCQVTYVEVNDPESAYNLEIDCPNIPQEYVDDDLLSTISGFETLCSYGACQETCNVDKENFLVDMKDCSFSVDDLLDLNPQPEASGANLNPQPEASGAHSFGKRKTTAGAVLLTMAAVSLVQHATWLNLF